MLSYGSIAEGAKNVVRQLDEVPLLQAYKSGKRRVDEGK